MYSGGVMAFTFTTLVAVAGSSLLIVMVAAFAPELMGRNQIGTSSAVPGAMIRGLRDKCS